MNKIDRNTPAQHSQALLRLPQVLQLIPVSKSTWWAWVADKKAPAAIRLGERCTCWRASDIAAFIEKLGGDK